MTTPRLQIALSPAGQLVLELPGAPGRGPRQIALWPGTELATIQRVLRGQLVEAVALGEDGSPTQAQVRHWERCGQASFGDERCPFCLAEGRAHAPRSATVVPSPSRSHEAGRGVRVTVLQGKGKARTPTSTRARAEDLGL